jgi:hypothetical protein
VWKQKFFAIPTILILGGEAAVSFLQLFRFQIAESEIVEVFVTEKSRVRRKTKSGAATKARERKATSGRDEGRAEDRAEDQDEDRLSRFPPEGLLTTSAATIPKAPGFEECFADGIGC